MVQFMRLLQPAQTRAVMAACTGMSPAAHNKIFKSMTAPVPATNFNLQTQGGKSISLSDYQGKIVVVNFWASWCSVCRSEKPSLESLEKEYGDDIKVLAVASDKDWAPVKRAMLGFEVSTAQDILNQPTVFGVRNEKELGASGDQMVVSRIDRGRPATKSGLRRLDRIVSIDGTPVGTPEALDQAFRSAGKVMKMTVSRKGETKDITLTDKESFAVLLDPPDDGGNLGAVAKSYGITAVPESFVIDRTGNIRHYFINKRNWDGDIAETCLQNLIDG
jgi:thiol-disulfide isomerase/thioredoxin